MADFRAVLFDLGGVVLGSPLHAIARYEAERGVPAGHINRVVVARGAEGAWARLERGELRPEAFVPAFERECAEAGHPISAREMLLRIAEAGAPRPAMVRAVERLRERGLRVGALTNNWEGDDDDDELAALRARFDAFVESRAVGLRKPDPRIYRHACERLGVEPPETIFLDDIGRNLKAARELGMATIKVEEPDRALADLERLLGLAARALA